jgi:hypothetical protein
MSTNPNQAGNQGQASLFKKKSNNVQEVGEL